MATFQHFVPKFYLQGFLDRDSVGRENIEPFLWVVDVESGTIKKKAPKNIAGASGYYNVQAESFGGDETILDKSITAIESQALPIIRQIRTGDFRTTIEERFRLANLIGIQIGRVPIFRRHVENSIEDAPSLWLQEYIKDDNRLKERFGTEAALFKEYILDRKIKPRIQFKDDAHKMGFIVSTTLKVGLEFAELIFGMQWQFLLASSEGTFFASDNPARLMSPNAKPLKIKFGELNEELEVSFPISATCCLWMHSHGVAENPDMDIGSNEIAEINETDIDKVNWSILPTIERYAFCSSENQARWILEQKRSKKRLF
jgi:Protein of unknown function (DUF4238)